VVKDRLAMRKLIIEGSALANENPSGVGYSLIRLLAALDVNNSLTDEYQIEVVVPTRKYQNALKHVGKLNHVRLRKNYLQNRVINGLNYLRILPFMDLIYGRGLYLFPNFKNWPLTKQSKSMTLIHDIAFLLFPETVEKKNQKMLQKNMQRWIDRTNLILTVSETSKREIMSNMNIPADKVDVLWNIIPKSHRNHVSTDEILEVRKKYNLPEKFTLFLSTIEPRKNLAQLLDAYDVLPNDIRQEHPLVVCGGVGWERDAVLSKLARAEKEGWVIRPGYIADVDKAPLYAAACLFIHPAIHEGFGLTPLESLSAGTPVLVNNIPVMHEVLGEQAAYVDFADAASASDAIANLLVNRPVVEPLSANKLIDSYSAEIISQLFYSIISRLEKI
jgi:glycosyltransferase involved in cell wall biosynthesis